MYVSPCTKAMVRGLNALIPCSRSLQAGYGRLASKPGLMPASRKSAKRRPARKQAKRGRGAARARSRAPRGARGRGPAGLFDGLAWRWPVLEQSQRDVLGLALVALGVFMAFVLYGSQGPPAPGGQVGHGLTVALG